MSILPQDLIGRRITGVDLCPFEDGRGGTAYAPELTLDNGRKLYFIVAETDVGEYGVNICITEGVSAPACSALWTIHHNSGRRNGRWRVVWGNSEESVARAEFAKRCKQLTHGGLRLVRPDGETVHRNFGGASAS